MAGIGSTEINGRPSIMELAKNDGLCEGIEDRSTRLLTAEDHVWLVKRFGRKWQYGKGYGHGSWSIVGRCVPASIREYSTRYGSRIWSPECLGAS